MIDLKTTIRSLTLKNPVILASGVCGYGDAYKDFYSPSLLGAVVTKGISLKPKAGNPPPRIWETDAGIINSIGLENIGLEKFINEKLPQVAKTGAEIIVNIFGETEEEFFELAERLDSQKGIKALELNLSCPNVRKGGIEFGRDPEQVKRIMAGVRKRTHLPIWVKLSLSRADPTPIAKIAEGEGADAIVLTNTLRAMAVDLKSKKPALGAITGGLSGPAIKPVALAGVFDLVGEISIPVIACGGVFDFKDALEFLLLGAKAVEVGTCVFADPFAPLKIIEGIKNYLEEKKISSLEQWIGAIEIE